MMLSFDGHTQRALRVEMLGLLRDTHELRLIAADAELPLSRIAWQGSLEVVTHEVINLANRMGDGPFNRFLRAVRARYPHAPLPTLDMLLPPSDPPPSEPSAQASMDRILGASLSAGGATRAGEGSPAHPPRAPGGSKRQSGPQELRPQPPTVGASGGFDFDAFLSYSWADQRWVHDLARRLRAGGVRVWLDSDQVAWGESVHRAIGDGLRRSRHVVLVMTPDSVGVGGGSGSAWVEFERLQALFADPANRSRRVLPLLARDCEVPAELRPYKYLDVRGPKLEAALPTLVETLRGAGTKGEATQPAEPAKAAQPAELTEAPRREAERLAPPAPAAEVQDSDDFALTAEFIAPVSDTWPEGTPRPEFASERDAGLSLELLQAWHGRQRLLEGQQDTRRADQTIANLTNKLRSGPSLHAGEIVGAGRYLLLKDLPAGLIAASWKALDLETDRLVHVRVLHPHLARDASRRGQYFHLMRQLSAISHPGLLGVLVAEDHFEGFDFSVTELLKPESLSSVGPGLGPDALFRAAGLVVEGLAQAHARGLMHRSITPGGIRVGPDDGLQLAGFESQAFEGHLKLHELDPSTPAESWTDSQKDMFALTRALLTSVTGRRVSRQSADLMALVDELSLPQAVRSCLHRTLTPYPTRRYASATEWAAELASAWSSQPAQTPSAPSPRPASRSNPFLPGKPLPAADAPPPGRAQEVARILELVEDENSLLLLAPRRGGKTSLLNHLEQRLKGSVNLLRLDLQKGAPQTPDQLALALDRDLKDVAEPAMALEDGLRAKADTRTVILLDEVGFLRKVDLSHQPTSFGWLRGLSQEGLATLVYSGTYDDWRAVFAHASQEPGSSFGNDLKHIELRPLDTSQALSWLAAAAPEDVPLSPSGVGLWMYEMAGGWPYYLQNLGYEVVSQVRKGHRALLADRAAVAAVYRGLNESQFRKIHEDRWRQLSPEVCDVLLRVDSGLPEYGALPLDEKAALRESGIYAGGEWLILEERPFMLWLEVNRADLRAARALQKEG